MNRSSFIGLFTILLFISSISSQVWFASSLVETLDDTNPSLDAEGDIEAIITAPNTVNMSQLNLYDYYENVRADRRFKWHIAELERTDNFHIREGDKKLKKGDNIILIMGGNPWLQRTEPQSWGQLYVNDVMARYPNDASAGMAIYKYLQPIGLNLAENYSGEFYNYTAMGNEGFFYYMEYSEYFNRTFWAFNDQIVTYHNTIISQVNNKTDITLIFDRATGLLNEMYYSAIFINGSGYPAGANLTMIRLHGWGLPYYITTWVVWIPLILILVGVIVAIRYNAFQRLKLYFEARKLAKRD